MVELAQMRGERLEEIGARIRLLRHAMGFERAALFAAHIGWSAQQLSNYENGQKRPEVTMAIQLCKKASVTLDWIYRGETAGLPLHVVNLMQDYLDRQAASAERA